MKGFITYISKHAKVVAWVIGGLLTGIIIYLACINEEAFLKQKNAYNQRENVRDSLMEKTATMMDSIYIEMQGLEMRNDSLNSVVEQYISTYTAKTSYMIKQLETIRRTRNQSKK